MPSKWVEAIRYTTFVVTAAVFAITILVFMAAKDTRFRSVGDAAAHMQDVFNVPWIPSFQIDYFMGVDGISFPTHRADCIREPFRDGRELVGDK